MGHRPSDAQAWFTTEVATLVDPVYRYFLRRSARQDADDLTAEVFEIAWRRCDDIPSEWVLPWLYRTASHVLANHRRRTSRLPLHLTDEPPPTDDHAARIMYASGPTGEIVSLGSYAVVSPAEAGERLSDPAFSARMVSSPDYLSVPPASLTAPPEAPQPGSAVPWKVVDREIVSVRLGLALLPDEMNQHRYLVPTYEYTAVDGTVWSVIALDEDELDTTGSG
ncbi:sigma factor [Microbacterium sp. LWH11-1.2]|uniref:RNA polymerase sigma factor n=1 Tax=Microbacterium sp. LWH11-1.2 TaxID=3135258 RepID=UPI0031389D01